MLNGEALLCGYLGNQRTIDYYRATLPQAEPIEIVERSVEQDVADRNSGWRTRGPLSFCAAVPPTRIVEFASILPASSWIADAAFGIVLGSNVDDIQVAAIGRSAADVGGSVRFFSEAGGKVSIDFSTNAVERHIIEQLKLAFDPVGKLNPLPRLSR